MMQNGREQVGLDYFSIRMDGRCSDAELLEQRIHNVSKEKGELERLEIELRAQMMAMEIQRNFESQSAEFANAAARMQVGSCSVYRVCFCISSSSLMFYGR